MDILQTQIKMGFHQLKTTMIFIANIKRIMEAISKEIHNSSTLNKTAIINISII